MKHGTHILFNEHTTILTVNGVVNNVVLVKQPQAIHLAISETRRSRVMKLGEVIAPLTLIIKTCKQFSKQCSSCKTTINGLRQYTYLAISETRKIRATKLGEVIATSNSDHKNM